MTMPDSAADPTAAPRPLPVWHPAWLIATGCGIGRLPKAPGTWASLAALPLAWLVDSAAGRTGIIVAGIAIAVIGIWASQVYVAHHRVQDPAEIVVDEVAAQLLTLAAVPLTFVSLIAGFVLFRLFDIAKPWPVSWADRSVKGGWGVMLDDLIAAGYGAIGLVILTMLQKAVFDVS